MKSSDGEGKPGALGECTLFTPQHPLVELFDGTYCKHCGGVLQKHKTPPLKDVPR